MSGIPYCGETLEVTGGCTKCSPGCTNCWAIKEVWRMAHNPIMGEKWKGLVEKKNGVLNWTGKIKCFEDALKKLRKKPTTYFIDSKADLFNPKVPAEYQLKVFETISNASQHTYLILTKRVVEMKEFFQLCEDWDPSEWPNVQLGVSISTPDEMWKVAELSRIPAAVRWISFEPLLADVGEIPLTSCREEDTDLEEFGQHIDWVVVGGESGPGARPMHPDWVRNIRDQCVAARVPFYFKQWGEWLSGADKFALKINTYQNYYPKRVTRIENTNFFRVGKKKAGRLLDRTLWNQLPERR